MATSDKPDDVERVACQMCLKEVPLSEATVPEARDYFVHFCGLDCYEKWKRRAAPAKDPADTSVP